MHVMQLITGKKKELILDNNDLEKKEELPFFQKIFLFSIKIIKSILLIRLAMLILE